MELTKSEVRTLLANRDGRARGALDRKWRAKLGGAAIADVPDPLAHQTANFGRFDEAATRVSARSLSDLVRAGITPSTGLGRQPLAANKLTTREFELPTLKSDIDLAIRQVVPPPGQTTQVMLLKKSPVTIFTPPYAWWERQAWSVHFQGGSIKDNASYLSGDIGRVGARLWGQNLSATDNSALDLFRSNGILLPYTMPKTGIPLIEVRLSANFCEHSIQTSDEFGISSCLVFTREHLECAFIWKFEDEVLQGSSSVSLVPGLYTASTTFSSFGGDGKAIFASPGDTRNIQVYPKTKIPQGAQVWLYIGTQCRVGAALNDVSTSAWINSSWSITEVAVVTLSI